MNSTDKLNSDLRPEDGVRDTDGSEPSDQSPSGQEVQKQREIGGRKGPDPTRYGDWEKAGRCIDF